MSLSRHYLKEIEMLTFWTPPSVCICQLKPLMCHTGRILWTALFASFDRLWVW